jgi:hypothetical protein
MSSSPYAEASARIDDLRRSLLSELAAIDAETKANPDEPNLDLYARAGAIAARVNLIQAWAEDVWSRLCAGLIEPEDAARELASLLPA